MVKIGKSLVAFAALCCILGAEAATAEPVYIQGGLIARDVSPTSAPGSGTVQGTQGFIWSGGFPADTGLLVWECTFFCSPASTFTLLEPIAGSELGGTITFDGNTYASGGQSDENAYFSPSFQGERALFVPAEAPLGTTASVSIPFSMNGGLIIPISLSSGIYGNYEVFGRGTFVAMFSSVADYPGGPVGWRVTGVEYRFADATAAPVPEPASLLLIAAGVGGVLARRRR